MLYKIIIFLTLTVPNLLFSSSGPFYVSPLGSDLNNGSSTNPFATIQKAVDVISAGVSNAACYLYPGTYTNNVIIFSNSNTNMIITALSNNNLPILSSSKSFGIKITNASKVSISYLKITGFTNNGIIITGTSKSNRILHNYLYSNGKDNILINSSSNFIIANNIYNASDGIFVNNCDNNIIVLNNIYKNSNGVVLTNSYENLIFNNNISTNSEAGVKISLSTNNKVATNIIGDKNGTGIYINSFYSNHIFRNLIKRNNSYGIHIVNSTNIEIVNNTIAQNGGDGIYWDTSSGKSINNIIYDNNTYGIKKAGTGTVDVLYTLFYKNGSGPTNGSLTLGNGILYDDPMIDTVTSFAITKVISPAVDSGTNIPIVAEMTKPDLGWKESPFTLTVPTAPSITAKALDCCRFYLEWVSLQNATSYTLFRNTSNGTNNASAIAGFSYDTTYYIDTGLTAETTYYYWIKAYNRLGGSPYSAVASDVTESLYYPLQYKVFPTTFNPSTDGKAKIFLTEDMPTVSIVIYDVAGNEIKRWERVEGVKYVEWDGRDKDGNELSPAPYIIHITGENIDELVKMILIK